jgi:hypothetical protein
MRGDPEFDKAINRLYRKKREKNRRKLFILRLVVVACGLSAVFVLFTWQYRPTRAATIPFGFGLIMLSVFDQNWRSLNQGFTFWYLGCYGAFYLLRVLFDILP